MLKILVVDDDAANCLLLRAHLENYGKSEIADNGEEALEAVKHSLDIGEPYDLICLDIMMPMMDGNETLRNIRDMEEDAKNSGISQSPSKIIMTTALGDIKTVFESYDNLCDAYLQKPIKKAALLKALVELKLIHNANKPQTK
ncbi:response regulator [Desulfogranum japonicum]|uniref:response regulator n=1 Tax=Desulfogranum japonicum TaxID=231447 RepID=UPI00040C0353|nr:response regulator [Desulfogranum japonicum]